MEPLSYDLQLLLGQGVITPSEAFRMQATGTNPNMQLAGSMEACAGISAAYADAKEDVMANGPESLRGQLELIERLFADRSDWTVCQKTPRMRSFLASYRAVRKHPVRQIPTASIWTRAREWALTDGDSTAREIARLWDECRRNPMGLQQRETVKAILVDEMRRHGWPGMPEEAAARAAREAQASIPIPSGTMDVVIPLGRGSRCGDEELRFCLRSILAHLADLRMIHIISPYRPDWLGEHERIRWHYWSADPIKDTDIVSKFIWASEQDCVTERFLAICDDWMLVDDVDSATYGGCVGGELAGSGEGYWLTAQKSTRSVLARAGFPHRYYDTHTPSVMTRTGWMNVDLAVRWRQCTGIAVWSLYHNVNGLHGESASGRYSIWHSGQAAPHSPEEIEESIARRRSVFAAFGTAGFNDVARAWLASRFPEVAPWEREATDEVPQLMASQPVANVADAGVLPTMWGGGDPFTADVLELLGDALVIARPDWDGYRARFVEMVAREGETRPLPPVGVVTMCEPGNAHLGDQFSISNLPRLLAARGYTVYVDDTRSSHAVFDGNPYVTGFGRVGGQIKPWFSRSERGHILQRYGRAYGLGENLTPRGEIYLSEGDLAWARAALSEVSTPGKPVILMNTGSVSSRNGYLCVDWQGIANVLADACTVVACVTTSPSSHVGTRNARWQRPDVGDDEPRGCVVFRDLPVRRWMALYAVCDGAIGTMGGACHVAAAMGTPYVCVLPNERPADFSLAFPQLGRNGVCDERWIYPQHLFAYPSEQPRGFPLSRDQVREQIIQPSERANVPSGQLWHIVSKYLVAMDSPLQDGDHVTEVGVRYGYSTAAWALARRNLTIHGIDILCVGDGAHGGRGGGEDTFPYVREMIARISPGTVLDLRHTNSQAMLQFPACAMAHVDGDHTCQGTLNDMTKAYMSLVHGGLLVVDDYHFIREVRDAFDLFVRQNADLIAAHGVTTSWRGEAWLLRAAPANALQDICIPIAAALEEAATVT